MADDAYVQKIYWESERGMSCPSQTASKRAAFSGARLTPEFMLFPLRSTTCAVWAQILEGCEAQVRFFLWVFRMSLFRDMIMTWSELHYGPELSLLPPF